GRAGDGQPGPNMLARTNVPAGANWSALPPITTPDPAAIRAPIPVTGNVSFSFWAPREQTPPHYHLWNVTVEKELDSVSLAQVAYVGNRGRNLPINYAYNICQQTRDTTMQFGYAATTSPYCPAAAGKVRRRLTVGGIVERAFGPGRRWANDGIASQIIGGWRATGVYTLSSGSPFGITDNSYSYCNASHTLTSRPMMSGDPLPNGFNQTIAAWFDRSAFDFSGTCPAPGLLAPTGAGDPNKAFGNAP